MVLNPNLVLIPGWIASDGDTIHPLTHDTRSVAPQRKIYPTLWSSFFNTRTDPNDKQT
jgi:hypothetical protein